MKRFIPTLLSLCAASAFAADVGPLAAVSNVSFTQDSQQDVIVTYDLANNGQPAFVTLDVLTNGVPLPVAAVQSLTSNTSVNTCVPLFSNSSLISVSRSAFLPVMISLSPFSANFLAEASPIPLVAPVIKTILFMDNNYKH